MGSRVNKGGRWQRFRLSRTRHGSRPSTNGPLTKRSLPRVEAAPQRATPPPGWKSPLATTAATFNIKLAHTPFSWTSGANGGVQFSIQWGLNFPLAPPRGGLIRVPGIDGLYFPTAVDVPFGIINPEIIRSWFIRWIWCRPCSSRKGRGYCRN